MAVSGSAPSSSVLCGHSRNIAIAIRCDFPIPQLDFQKSYSHSEKLRAFCFLRKKKRVLLQKKMAPMKGPSSHSNHRPGSVDNSYDGDGDGGGAHTSDNHMDSRERRSEGHIPDSSRDGDGGGDGGGAQ